jgi:hypothetical protein
MREIARRACRRERIGRSALHDGGVGRVARRQLHRAPPQPGDRGFESISLQRGVRCEPTFGGAPIFAGCRASSEGRAGISSSIGGVRPNTYDRPDAPIQSISQLSRSVPQQRVEVLDIEVQLGNFISPARRYDCQPEPERETRFKIDTVHLARVIKARRSRRGATRLTNRAIAQAGDPSLGCHQSI